jgi:hypothetical protein
MAEGGWVEGGFSSPEGSLEIYLGAAVLDQFLM